MKKITTTDVIDKIKNSRILIASNHTRTKRLYWYPSQRNYAIVKNGRKIAKSDYLHEAIEKYNGI